MLHYIRLQIDKEKKKSDITAGKIFCILFYYHATQLKIKYKVTLALTIYLYAHVDVSVL